VIGGLGPHGYTAAKTAVVGLTKSVASELGQYTIRVNAIAPGTIPTGLTAQALAGDRGNLAAVAEHARQTNGMNIASDPMDIAHAAVYLASDESRLVNGHTLVVDAGRSVNGGSARFASSAVAMVDVEAELGTHP
jgi:NAD(P)-dependent dehydrogenase (short-subunit alcohol dehydrogenase family)